jgi:hypothetical protein
MSKELELFCRDVVPMLQDCGVLRSSDRSPLLRDRPGLVTA